MPSLSAVSSTNRLVDLITPSCGGLLVAEKVRGVETLGRLFEYEIFALSEDTNVIDFDKLLGKHITLAFELGDGSRRYVDGRVAQVGLIGMVDNLVRYRIVARPWTWMLTRTADCKIFQNKDVKAILEEVFADQPDADFELNLTGSYTVREYCVQYRETDFNFISRLMEEEGIYTFFRHEKGKHILVVCDAVGAHQSIGDLPFLATGKNPTQGIDYVREWSVTREIQPGMTSLQDYNFEKPSVDLRVKLEKPREHGESEHEVFDYPGEYAALSEGDVLVKHRLEELQAAHEVIIGSGEVRELTCGCLFTLKGFGRSDQNRAYLTVATRIDVDNNPFESNSRSTAKYRCGFELVPSDVPYRTPRSTPRPVVKGPQTAVVVGPAGEEIFVDKYGRVKVQFHWDRLGKNDDTSSCFIRVSQVWAGKNFGWMTIPRIGQEVIVDFLEGDADRPIITGRVYNAEQMPPFELPANKTQSGLRTRSSLKGEPTNENVFRFEDKKGSEQVFLHAEKNNDIEVEADETHWVGHDRKKTIDNDENVEVKNNRTEKVGVDETITIGSNRTEEVGANEKITIKGNRTVAVTGDEDLKVTGSQKEDITGSRELKVTGSEKIQVMSSHDETILGSAKQTITGSLTQTVTGGITITTPAAMKVTATGGVTFTAPGGFTVIAPGGTKTVDFSFESIGGKRDEIFSNSTSINTLANSVSVSNNAYAAIKVDTASVVMEAIQVKNANNPVTIQVAATNIRNGALGLILNAMVMLG